MKVVPVDSRGRITFPKESMIRETKAVIIPAGSFVVVVPLPKEPLNEASSWLRSKRSRKDLKKLADDLARKESVKRAKRQKQKQQRVGWSINTASHKMRRRSERRTRH